MVDEYNFEMASIPLFSGLSQDQLNILKDITYVKEFEEGELLFLEGEESTTFYIILSGEVQIIKDSREGKEKILKIMEPGDFFGEMGIVEGKPRSATARASCKSKLLVYEKDDFLHFIKDNPEIAFNIIIELSHRLRLANNDIENLAFFDVQTRLLRILTRLGRKKGEGFIFERKITHHELAKMAGTSRETVTRILNKMEKEGLVKITDNKIYIKKFARR